MSKLTDDTFDPARRPPWGTTSSTTAWPRYLGTTYSLAPETRWVVAGPEMVRITETPEGYVIVSMSKINYIDQMLYQGYIARLIQRDKRRREIRANMRRKRRCQ